MSYKQEKIIELNKNVKLYDNDYLFKETMFLSKGDDYDGCFTEFGAIEYNIFLKELIKRLIENNFLSKEYKDE